jgi:hypothetical protein
VHFRVTIAVTTVGSASGKINLPLPTGTTVGPFVAVGREIGQTNKAVTYEADGGATTGTVALYDATFPGASGNVIVVTGIYEQT